jgi:RimJ/RimL family protein N-acetyltransferase
LWETTVNNIPSQKVAEKLGFEKVEEYPVYSIKIEHSIPNSRVTI